MGLDMYLEGKKYFGGRFNEEEQIVELKRKAKFDEKEDILKLNVRDIEEITIHLGYWRKANAIHKWFVDNCFEGNYDEYHGEDIYVGIEQLEQLKQLCKKVLNLLDGQPYKKQIKIIEENLPMQTGFFFGYDDTEQGIKWYIEDLKDTIQQIDIALKKIKKYGLHSAIYNASW